jgi:hypothetical protein
LHREPWRRSRNVADFELLPLDRIAGAEWHGASGEKQQARGGEDGGKRAK